jgi:uncharacterized protein
MARSELLVDTAELASLCNRYGVSKLHLFGSYARGTQGEASDLDLLYELRPGCHLGWEIEQLSDELAELFGKSVDLVSKDSLNEHLRDNVLAESRSLYAA